MALQGVRRRRRDIVTTTGSIQPDGPQIQGALFALAMASLGIGMGEFLIVGLVPDLAADLRVPVHALACWFPPTR
jgi:hypothetical protein